MSQNCGLFHNDESYSMLHPHVNDAAQQPRLSLLMESMGQRIRRLREAKRLSQPELGKLIGVTKGAVSQWERGDTQNIRLKNLLRLLSVLGTDTEYLVYGPDRSARDQSVILLRDIRRQKT